MKPLILAKYFNQNNGYFRLLLFVLSSIPAVLLFFKLWTNNLGSNPFAYLIESTGLWSFVFLLLALTITPLRRWLRFICTRLKCSYGKRLSDWNFLIISRRMLGLWCFAYSCGHLFVYLYLEIDWDLEYLIEDFLERPFLTLGAVAWIINLLLALTSPKFLQKKLGVYWRKLHRCIYALALLALAHVLLEAKVAEYEGYWFLLFLTILLGHRLVVWKVKAWRKKDDLGLEEKRPS